MSCAFKHQHRIFVLKHCICLLVSTNVKIYIKQLPVMDVFKFLPSV